MYNYKTGKDEYVDLSKVEDFSEYLPQQEEVIALYVTCRENLYPIDAYLETLNIFLAKQERLHAAQSTHSVG